MIPRRDRRTVRAVHRHSKRTAAVARQLPELEPGASYGLLLDGCGMVELVTQVAAWVGPCTLHMATWALSLSSVRTIDRCPQIMEVNWILDRSTDGRRPKVLAAAQETGSVRVVSSHAKVAVLLGADRGAVLAGSANATMTKGHEWMDLDTDLGYAVEVLEVLRTMEEV